MNKKPEFCIITPINYLERFASQSSMHLVLAHLIDSSSEYREFYYNQEKFKIMDNSAYELKEPYAPERLVSLGKACRVDAIVLPDYPFKKGKLTVDAAEEMGELIRDAGFSLMFVPQSETGDLEDWIACYDWASRNPLIDIIGMSILGIPNALPHIHPAYARVVMTQILIERGVFNPYKHHHYLGLNAGPALEIPSLIKMGVVDSIDSSGPVYAGLLGHRYTKDADSYQMVSKLKVPVDFHIPMTKDQDTLERIQHNIDLTLDLFKPDVYNKENVWYAQE